MAESKEELKSLLMNVKEKSENTSLKQHAKNKDHGNWFHHFMANRWVNNFSIVSLKTCILGTESRGLTTGLPDFF